LARLSEKNAFTLRRDVDPPGQVLVAFRRIDLQPVEQGQIQCIKVD
jgi:hypothetical protein